MLAPARPSTSTPALGASDLPAAVVSAATLLSGGASDAAYFYDPTIAAARAAQLRAALPPWAEVAFAVKANAFAPVLAALAAEVDGFDVASVAELEAVQVAARGRRLRLLAAGPGKTPAFLDALVAAGTDPVNVESALELERLAAAGRRAGRRVPVALRVNPERVPLTGALRMGGSPGPFGVPEADVGAVLALAARLPELDVKGFHVHAISGNLDAEAHVAYVRWCLEWSARTASAHGVDLRVVDAGGGLGVRFDGGSGLDVVALGRGLARLTPPAGVRLVLEPGRWITAPCGWYAAPVTDLKRSHGTWFAVLRGGINHFALPASWDLVHRLAVVPVEAWEAGCARPEVRGVRLSVVGELCTPEDALAHDVAVDHLRAGDVLVFPDAGSYGWEFALPHFLGHPPARRQIVDANPHPTKEQHR